MKANHKSDFPGWYGHWVVKYGDFILDPSFGDALTLEEYYASKRMSFKHFTSFVEVHKLPEVPCFF